MSTINKLYFLLSEVFENSKDYEEVNKKYYKIYEKILKLLPDEAKLMDELFEQTGGLESEYGQMCFKEGFKLAFRLAAESYS